MQPLVTAIIPCYNRADYIVETARSVLDQTYENIEILVIDDGCTDGTREILESFGDLLTILEHPNRENRGQSAGINLGLAHAKGEYIGILDSDDLWLPDKIERQAEYLEFHRDVGLVHGNGEAVDDKLRRLYEIRPPHDDGSAENILLDCYFALPSNSLVRHSVYDQIGGFDETIRAGQDHDMAVRIAEVSKVAHIDAKVFKYRRHIDSISRKKSEIRWRNGFVILDKAIERYRYPREIIRKRRAVLHFRVAQCLIESRRWLTASWHLILAFVNDPARSIKVVSGGESVTSPH